MITASPFNCHILVKLSFRTWCITSVQWGPTHFEVPSGTAHTCDLLFHGPPCPKTHSALRMPSSSSPNRMQRRNRCLQKWRWSISMYNINNHVDNTIIISIIITTASNSKTILIKSNVTTTVITWAYSFHYDWLHWPALVSPTVSADLTISLNHSQSPGDSWGPRRWKDGCLNLRLKTTNWNYTTSCTSIAAGVAMPLSAVY